MAIIKFAYQCKEVNDQNKFQKAKDYMKEIVQHRFRHTSFGLYAKYDPKDDSITLWLTQPSDTKLFLENVLDSDIEALTGNKEVGFHIAKGEGGFLKKRELEDLTKRWPIQIGQLSEKQMADAF
ncbi:MAG: hypothetical protein ACE5HI_15345, partial [bacterium]